MAHQSHLAEPQLNATPLIDVLLVLSIMLIFTLPIATQSVQVNLPQGVRGAPPPVVNLEVMCGGDIYCNGRYLSSIDDLMPLLAEAARSKETMVRVLAEKRAPYERVAQVLTAARHQHVERLSVLPVPDP
jgi:biopolymer transport protein ExbD